MSGILNEAAQRRTRALAGLWFFLSALLASSDTIAAVRQLHHDLKVRLDPATSMLEVEDRITLPHGSPLSWRFSLGSAFQVEAHGGRLHPLDGAVPGGFREYRLDVKQVPAAVTLRYSGHVADGAARADHGMPTAVLDARGVFLDGASGWYPSFESALATFRLEVDLPDGWEVVSQGKRVDTQAGSVWETRAPQDDIYLIGGRFSRYAQAHRGVELEVYLLQPDEDLARRYLGVMGQYIDFYSALIADYPYPKFAVVENRWQTGYGMASFTLLGSRVLRLPFILHSSLPHEILHNWWGNGVYVDVRRGNWSEGLTAYLSDHLIKEAQGQGAAYRRQALERYASYAADGRDFPLRLFRARHGDASQAVGYGKALMVFHMARRELGDAAFVAGLKDFWDTWRFHAAGYGDLKAAWEQTAGRALRALDDRWLDWPGAPALALVDADAESLTEGDYRLRLTLAQVQEGPLYPLRIPVAVRLAGSDRAIWREVVLDVPEISIEWSFDHAVERVDVDPDFDVFRLLDERERPAALAQLFGAPHQLLVLPGDAPEAELGAWRALAAAWGQRYDNVETRLDRDIDRLPDDQAVWLLGWGNRWLARSATRFNSSTQTLTPEGLNLDGERYGPGDYAVVVLDSDNARSPFGFMGAPDATSVAGLARKLPHYGRYGRLVFDVPGMENRLREDLPVPRSPLTRVFVDRDPGPPENPAAPLTDLVGVALRFD